MLESRFLLLWGRCRRPLLITQPAARGEQELQGTLHAAAPAESRCASRARALQQHGVCVVRCTALHSLIIAYASLALVALLDCILLPAVLPANENSVISQPHREIVCASGARCPRGCAHTSIVRTETLFNIFGWQTNSEAEHANRIATVTPLLEHV